jgi:hypothetical protein
MSVELRDLVVDLASSAVAFVDAAVSGLWALFAAGASNGLDPGPLAGGAAAGAAAGGAAASGGRSGDRGFRYSSGGTVVYDSPGGTVVATVPTGGRLVYDGVVRDSGGNPTHYHVHPPGGRSGYVPAGTTSDTRPTPPPQRKPSVVIDSGIGLANTSSAQAGSRG